MVLSSFLVLAWFRQSNYSQTYFQYTFSLVSSDAFYLRKVSCLLLEDCKELKMYRKGKGIRKKRHLDAFDFVFSVFGENFAETSCWEIL